MPWDTRWYQERSGGQALEITWIWKRSLSVSIGLNGICHWTYTMWDVLHQGTGLIKERLLYIPAVLQHLDLATNSGWKACIVVLRNQVCAVERVTVFTVWQQLHYIFELPDAAGCSRKIRRFRSVHLPSGKQPAMNRSRKNLACAALWSADWTRHSWDEI